MSVPAIPFPCPPLLGGFAFQDAPLDRADPLRDDPDALRRHWPDARLLVLDAQGRLAADAQGAALLLRGADVGGGPGTAVFLGLDGGGQAWFALEAGTLPAVAAGQWIDLRRAAALWPAAEAGAFAYARGMLYWHARNRYCGVCGGGVQFRRAGFVGHCAQCGNDHYPRVDPAVIMAVGDGERLLLGRQAGWAPRRWSVLAGFIEPGESPEQAVVREVHEETGVRVRACRYLGAQPWPFPGALMLGYQAFAEADPPRVSGELEEARWFTREEVGQALARDERAADGPLLAPSISIAHALIARWHAGEDASVTPA
ncbi:NAD(+) diphosphatase [Pseudoxanthomonas broegbernensis]|uniref:NAD(+) diphosphatase n=1 Tax=Pseudoxanthomonas broegbernensis TaxID=83619 RepID=UPI0017D1B668|nr:NAD(+) diphosphatase [Pseudoxanthomonas broegbernensis]MBB6065818.1 NAD+ diphosphatase [Pseudoxanthomonas broegbernensis]